MNGLHICRVSMRKVALARPKNEIGIFENEQTKYALKYTRVFISIYCLTIQKYVLQNEDDLHTLE
jgi:hypothetical protein